MGVLRWYVGATWACRNGWEQWVAPVLPDRRLKDPEKIQADVKAKEASRAADAAGVPILGQLTSLAVVEDETLLLAWSGDSGDQSGVSRFFSICEDALADDGALALCGYDVSTIVRLALGDAALLRQRDPDTNIVPIELLWPSRERVWYVDPYHLLCPLQRQRDLLSLNTVSQVLGLPPFREDMTALEKAVHARSLTSALGWQVASMSF